MKHLQDQTNPHTIVYMEVYGMNRVIYQVTACQASKKSKQAAVYGVSLTDMRTGENACLQAYSDSLEETIFFANRLIAENVEPNRLYDAALGTLYQNLLSKH